MSSEQELLVHDLEIHQIELETQNRQLRETETRLELSMQRYRELYDFAPIAYFTLDLDGRIQDANLTAATLLGIERGALLGKALLAFVDTTHRAQLRAHLERCTRQHVEVGDRLELLPRGGSPLSMKATSVPAFDETGRVTGCRTALTDVSALKRTEDRMVLLASASQTLARSLDVEQSVVDVLRSILPSLADMALIDLVHRSEVRRWEARCHPREPGGVQITKARRPTPWLGPDAPQSRVLESGKAILVSRCDERSLGGHDGLDHEPLIRQSGARSLLYVPLSSRETTLGVLTLISLDGRKSFSGADLLFATDLASRIATAVDNGRLYAEAKAAVRAREDILSFVAHDLRSFLFGSNLGIEILMQSISQTERWREWRELERIHRLNVHMGRVVEDLLDVSSLDAGRLSLRLTESPARELLSQATEALSETASAAGVALATDAVGTSVKVSCDPGRVMQIFANIIGNAVKFTPRGGAVTLSASEAGEQIQFAVRDTGPGVAPEELEHLFERYWQAKRNAHTGVGLGLHIAKHLVEAQGGRIWVESRLGAGTTLFFTLPRVGGAETVGHRTAPQGASGGRAWPT